MCVSMPTALRSASHDVRTPTIPATPFGQVPYVTQYSTTSGKWQPVTTAILGARVTFTSLVVSETAYALCFADLRTALSGPERAVKSDNAQDRKGGTPRNIRNANSVISTLPGCSSFVSKCAPPEGLRDPGGQLNLKSGKCGSHHAACILGWILAVNLSDWVIAPARPPECGRMLHVYLKFQVNAENSETMPSKA
jgi:hypothetical protein